MIMMLPPIYPHSVEPRPPPPPPIPQKRSFTFFRNKKDKKKDRGTKRTNWGKNKDKNNIFKFIAR